MKNKKVAVGVFVIGAAVLIAGVVMLILNILAAGRAADGEFLVTAGEWHLQDNEGVVWQFTEIGKGTLTTNNHTNDYDFIWAIEGNKLKIETNWLYELENEYVYNLDQGGKVLTLKDGETEVRFIAN